MCNHKNMDLLGFVINSINYSPVSHSIAKESRHYTSETSNAAVPSRLALKLCETTDQLSRERLVRRCEEFLGLR